MIDHVACVTLLEPEGELSGSLAAALDAVGFDDRPGAVQRFRTLCETQRQREACARIVPALLHALEEAATPDGSLLNFQRFVQTVENREQLFQLLADQPRAVEILVRLFVGSQFLTEILLRNPHYLDRLTEHKRLAEFKSREEFIQGAESGATDQGSGSLSDPSILHPQSSSLTQRDVMNHLRRYQQWELLRIAACDTFGLMDLKSVTLQLALLADALVQLALDHVVAFEGIDAADFAVLGFGKLGGEELNYSSDIDLVFVCEQGAERYWGIGQKLIKVLSDPTDLGFLYRVDMRLRPWGTAGALVTTADAYVQYMQKHGRLWEQQALLKARTIAGNMSVGNKVLERLQPIIFDVDPDDVRANVKEMKAKIEQYLEKKGQRWGEVKGGPGGIRDIEFVTQFLQLAHGRSVPEVRTTNTLDGLVRLADFELIFSEEYRRLSSAYIVLRTIEHALQILHNKQEHLLPNTPRGLNYLARRLDFPDAATFVQQFERHTKSVREIFERHIHQSKNLILESERDITPVDLHFGTAAESYYEYFAESDAEQHVRLLDALSAHRVVRVDVVEQTPRRFEVTIVGFDRIGDLSAICGLLFAYGFDIESGHVFTGADVAMPRGDEAAEPRFPASISWRDDDLTPFHPPVSRYSPPNLRRSLKARKRKYVNVFLVRWEPARGEPPADLWQRFEEELNELMLLSGEGGVREAQGRLVHRVASAFENVPADVPSLLPVEIEIDDATSTEATILHIRGDDTPGFLYELTNAIAVSGLSIVRMNIQSSGHQVLDTLHVVDEQDRKLSHRERLQEFRAAIVLIKHFTHLLPRSPNPESALLHFQEFLENLFQMPNWLEQLSPLQDSEVLNALARLLGVSDFLWDDFLRLQHENLFPVVTDVEGLQQAPSREHLTQVLTGELAQCPPERKREVLNAFKDREMMRVDMRHIMGLEHKFGSFSRELTAVAETVVEAAWRICDEELSRIHGRPLSGRSTNGTTHDGDSDHARHPSRLAICALGKCGGAELGYASDIELMFIYEVDGETSGGMRLNRGDDPQGTDDEMRASLNIISNVEYYQRLVECIRKSIHSKRKGIFEIDLRLRPYGKAGSLAVSIDTFEKYFSPDGPAWPYERQALVKLRPIAGDAEFGERIVETRDRMIYRGEPFDVAAMKAMREKQNRQLVQAGTFNAKLSPGGLVDCEYLVQALQITYGHLDKSIREPNTREAMKALEAHGILEGPSRIKLRDAYRFFRRVIDALRMVRGDASDLTVPPSDSDQFLFLARRLGYDSKVNRLRSDLERHTRNVIELSSTLEQRMRQSSWSKSD